MPFKHENGDLHKRRAVMVVTTKNLRYERWIALLKV